MLPFFTKKDKTVEEQCSIDLSIHKAIHDKLNYFYESNKIPHIIFYGSSGSGKRTIVDHFLRKIYKNDKAKMKSGIIIVNCAHGKGIKLIREELKFFAKTNIQSNNGITFKTIVLLNADYLTIDAQSALRRCIELFSHNTRFFIIVENKQKLLNPILSRFCEIYIPEHTVDGKIVNLHVQSIMQHYTVVDGADEDKKLWIQEKMNDIATTDDVENLHLHLTDIIAEWYEMGYSCIDLVDWVQDSERFDAKEKASFYVCFDKIRTEFRCEKLLLLYLLDYLFLRLDKDVKNVYVL
uniref:AAA+ ATPase domain-containing protein n=1 Tax=viral metagenome TaxID=1070528 RepID=A0A6C0I3R7_9ZZZZ